ncbi:MAG: cation:proton antiporter [Prevotellaceae bacterium]|jgi:CPA2 family monovalent cation:H+ antiporter-2|nr:cation:proton antiporter [Prevotellaceae bacterium]
MSHLAPLISDLALILITAGITTVLFKWMKQPVVLGYIVAGFLIGPHFFLLPSVADPGNITIWADIGIIFLLFALGLEFSFKRLITVGGTAAIATLINMGSMIVIGYFIGQLMGRTQVESLFLGGMLSMSSTTIIIKAFNDMGLQKKKFAGIVFGMLIVEDLAAILMMVLLSTIAVSKHVEETELLTSLLRLIFFIVIWFVSGIFLIPTLLKKVKRFLNDEMLLITAVGLCLGMVLFANVVGFSAALGAFIMGSILAETVESKRIEHLIDPLKNLFGAVFFVSVGMMIAPSVFVEHTWTILTLTAVVLVGRVIFATVGVLASGEGLKVSLQAGFSLAQIGEFSFIIAALGMQLGVIGNFFYPVIVTVSIVTTFTTPYFIRLAEPVHRRLAKVIPPKYGKLLNGFAIYKKINKQSAWSEVWRNVITSFFIFTTLALAMFFLSRQYITPFITAQLPNVYGKMLAAAVALLLMSPFLVGAMLPRRNMQSQIFKLLITQPGSHLHKVLFILLGLARIAIFLGFILMTLSPLFPNAKHVLALLSIPIMGILLLIEVHGSRPQKMMNIFLKNFNAKEHLEENSKAVNQQVTKDLLSQNVHVVEVEVLHNAPIVGQTLAELNFKQSTGVTVICIIRGAQRINVPKGSERIFPFDKIAVAGSDEEIQKFMHLTQEKILAHAPHESFNPIMISQLVIEKKSPVVGSSIKELKFREKTGCLIISIGRGSQMITEFSASFVLQEGDVLWLAGESKQLGAVEENLLATA